VTSLRIIGNFLANDGCYNSHQCRAKEAEREIEKEIKGGRKKERERERERTQAPSRDDVICAAGTVRETIGSAIKVKSIENFERAKTRQDDEEASRLTIHFIYLRSLHLISRCRIYRSA